MTQMPIIARHLSRHGRDALTTPAASRHGSILRNSWPAYAVFVGRVEEALHPEFQRQPFLYGGEEPRPAEKLRQDAEEQTARVRAWAAEFRRLLGVGLETPGFRMWV